jgi:hypothetical protein
LFIEDCFHFLDDRDGDGLAKDGTSKLFKESRLKGGESLMKSDPNENGVSSHQISMDFEDEDAEWTCFSTKLPCCRIHSDREEIKLTSGSGRPATRVLVSLRRRPKRDKQRKKMKLHRRSHFLNILILLRLTGEMINPNQTFQLETKLALAKAKFMTLVD